MWGAHYLTNFPPRFVALYYLDHFEKKEDNPKVSGRMMLLYYYFLLGFAIKSDPLKWKTCLNSKNFVLCPGGAYDRSPCGTGTSAKLACLAADGKLEPGEIWSQESIIGSVFNGSYEWIDKSRILPTITGSAHLSSRGELLWQEGDPFGQGI